VALRTDRSPFAYRGGTSFLHRVPAGIKLLCLLVLSLAAFSSVPGLAAAALVTAAGALGARVRPRELLRGSKPLAVLAAFIVVFRTASFRPPFLRAGELPAALVSGLCIIVSFAAGALFFATTTTGELRRSLGRLETAVRSLFTGRFGKGGSGGGGGGRLSLALSLMLGFIPRFFELWETANLACDARAGKRGPRRLFFLLPLVTERMLERAAATAQALEARGAH
jgi:biotin transport system permease protein